MQTTTNVDTASYPSANHPGAVAGSSAGEGKIIASWTAPQYFEHHKSARWYQVALAVVVISSVLAFLDGNWSMALAIIVFAFVYQSLHTSNPSQQIRIVISELGIRVGPNFYPYSHIQAFWIIYDNGIKTLNLRPANNFFYDIIIQLNDQDPVAVRKYLVGQIPEWEGKSERLGDVILRLLKL